MKELRIVFMGTPEFAVQSLRALLNSGSLVVGVITAPDKPAGRGRQLQESAVKRFAVEQGLKVLQPVNLKDPVFLEELRALKADLQVVVAFRMLPEAVWNMPRLGTYNLHASLLPRYRGAAPINWALINGEKESGVTIFKLRHEIDSGQIIRQEKMKIEENENAGSLHDRMMVRGSELLVAAMKELEKTDGEGRKIDFIEQNAAEVCHAPKLNRDNCRIDWSKDGENIRNLVRGLSPYPGAWCLMKNLNGEESEFKILSCRFIARNEEQPPGKFIVGKDSLRVSVRNGELELMDIQVQGKKRMSSKEFLNGFRALDQYTLV